MQHLPSGQTAQTAQSLLPSWLGWLTASLLLLLMGAAALWWGALADAAPASAAPPAPQALQDLLQRIPQASPQAVHAAAPSAATLQAAATAANQLQRTPPDAAAVLPDTARDLASVVKPGEVPTMQDVIKRLHEAGIYTGLGAFSPPGTRPPLIGLAVPDNFVLPDGYVRHHQATDDGQRIEAILMFAPERQFFDSAGRPIPVPANRVVPPEYAPPGMPLRQIVLPAPLAVASPS